MDVEALLVSAAQAQFPAARVLTRTPNNMEQYLPVVKLAHTGGVGDWQRMDTLSVEGDVFAATESAAGLLAWDVYHWFMEQFPAALGAVGVRRVDSLALPIETAYDNPDVYRFTFNVTIHTHDRRL